MFQRGQRCDKVVLHVTQVQKKFTIWKDGKPIWCLAALDEAIEHVYFAVETPVEVSDFLAEDVSLWDEVFNVVNARDEYLVFYCFRLELDGVAEGLETVDYVVAVCRVYVSGCLSSLSVADGDHEPGMKGRLDVHQRVADPVARENRGIMHLANPTLYPMDVIASTRRESGDAILKDKDVDLRRGRDIRPSVVITRRSDKRLERDEVVVFENLDLFSRFTDDNVFCGQWVDGECLRNEIDIRFRCISNVEPPDRMSRVGTAFQRLLEDIV